MHSRNRLNSRHLRGGASLLLVSLLLTGCGLLESKKAEYKLAQRAKPLDIPPELSAPAKDDRYTVSELGSKGTTFSSYNAERAAGKSVAPDAGARPETVAPVLPQSDKIRVERAGNHRWLVIPGAPDQVWAAVRRFLESRSMVIKSEAPELGILETEWAEKTVYVPESGFRGQLAKALGTLYSTSERDKYRFRLEKGIDPGTTEVFISHRGVEEVYVTEGREQTRWQPRASDPELEAEMLTRLMQFAGTEQKKAVVAAVTEATVSAGDRARLLDGAKLLLEVDERFDRAWRRVGLALDRNGFTVEDRDRAKGLYYVRYFDPNAGKAGADKSWLESLAFWRTDAAVDSGLVTYRVAVVGAGDELSRVEVQEKSGGHLNTSAARQILEIVRKELK